MKCEEGKECYNIAVTSEGNSLDVRNVSDPMVVEFKRRREDGIKNINPQTQQNMRIRAKINNRGVLHINKNNIVKKIKYNELKEYIIDGWQLGRPEVSISKEDINKIKTLKQEGIKHIEISKYMNISRRRISEILCEFKPTKIHKVDPLIDIVKNERSKGTKLIDISIKYNITYSKVNRILYTDPNEQKQKPNYPKYKRKTDRKIRKITQELADEIYKNKSNGMSHTELRNKYKIGHTRLRKILNEMTLLQVI